MATASLDEHEIRVFRHREHQVLDVHTALSADFIDSVELSESQGMEKLLIRADRPFFYKDIPI